MSSLAFKPAWFPLAITAEALAYDRQFAWTLWITGIIFVAGQILLAWTILRGRKRLVASPANGNRRLELTWLTATAAPFITLSVLGSRGWAKIPTRTAIEFISDASSNSVGVDPNDPAGKDDIVTANLRTPAHRNVLLLHSRDVIHRASLPQRCSRGFMSIIVTGGLSGLFLGQPQIDAYFHDTYFVVAHFHLIMGIAALFGIFAATFYWFPLMFGRMMDERLGKLHFYLTFIGAYATFLPMHFAGFAGNPRRYSDFTTFDFLAKVMPLQRWITFSSFFLASVQVIFLWNLFHSMKHGKTAPNNPWESTTLEWSDHAGPVVRGPYEYSQPSAARDYIMQNDAPSIPSDADGTTKTRSPESPESPV